MKRIEIWEQEKARYQARLKERVKSIPMLVPQAKANLMGEKPVLPAALEKEGFAMDNSSDEE